jgi:acetyl-CoA acetyltransferase
MTEEKAAQLAAAREKAAEANLGNTHSSKINRLMNETLKRILIQNEGLRARTIAEALVTKAEDGDVPAIKEVFDRVDGKVVQENKLTGDPEAPIIINVITGIDD